MPSINLNPFENNLPQEKALRQKARTVVSMLKRRAENDPDSDESDWVVHAIVKAFVDGKLTYNKEINT